MAYIFSYQKSQFGHILDGLGMENVGILYILSFGIFHSHLVNFLSSLPIFCGQLVYFCPFWYVVTKINLATLLRPTYLHSKWFSCRIMSYDHATKVTSDPNCVASCCTTQCDTKSFARYVNTPKNQHNSICTYTYNYIDKDENCEVNICETMLHTTYVLSRTTDVNSQNAKGQTKTFTWLIFKLAGDFFN
jgi:hypothetical protein